MTYRAAPISQRDGSSLQYSNCRMASIATGLDYDTLGKKKSTGAKMRSYTSDQQGGTDSGDAKQAWSNGYAESLTIRDGNTFDTALADLRAGRLVHLDVWHAAAGGPCLSGSGAYGHTMAVGPEKNGSRWLVADPWCSPGKWVWWEEASLRRGAEEWGRRVYNNATGGLPPVPVWDAALLLLILAAAKAHMTKYHAGGDEDPTPSPPDTGGPQPILFTTTAAHADGGGGGGTDVKWITATGYDDRSKQTISVPAGTDWYYFDGTRGGSFSKTTTVYVFGLTDTTGEYAVQISTGNPFADGEARPILCKVKIKPALVPKDICPPVPPTPTDTYVPVGTLYVKEPPQ